MLMGKYLSVSCDSHSLPVNDGMMLSTRLFDQFGSRELDSNDEF